MTQRLDKINTDKDRGPNSKLVTNGPEARNENRHDSPDKIRRLQLEINLFTVVYKKLTSENIKIFLSSNSLKNVASAYASSPT